MDVNPELDQLLKRLARETSVPPEEPARLQGLLDAFEAAQRKPGSSPRRDYWWMGTLATAAAVLIAVALSPSWFGLARTSRSSTAPVAATGSGHDVQPPAGGFVIVPGAASLPPLESGSLVRMDLPVSILPSLGMTPPATGSQTEVTADVIVGQDGLPRAVRLVE